MPDPNVVVGRKYQVLPIEVVVRGHITGTTNTSLWTNYENGQRDFGDFHLPEGLRKNQQLEHMLITPTTKFEEHDRPLTSTELVESGLMDKDIWASLQTISLQFFCHSQTVASERGLKLVDTKYEFGISENGEIVLIDELHTSDSSRYWRLDNYQEAFERGIEPDYYDKEFLRLWYKSHSNPYKDFEMPLLPAELKREMTKRYVYVYEQLTGKIFQQDISQPIADRIRTNLGLARKKK